MSHPLTITHSQAITIIGAGLAGSLLAVYLARRGFQVELFERDPDPRKAAATAEGRSINLALAQRGIAALKGVGLHHRVAQLALPMVGRMVHLEDGPSDLLRYGQSPSEVIYSVHRQHLNQTLIDAAEGTRRVRCHFRQQLKSVDLDAGISEFVDHASGRSYQRSTGPLIGADGVGSTVRKAIEQATGGKTHSQLLDHGYREFGIPANGQGDFALRPDALHIWPRGDFMLIALPNLDRSFTATAFMANQGPESFASISRPTELKAFFQAQFPDIAAQLESPNTDEPPIGVLGSLSCEHWYSGGRALILGDAAHAIVPFHGQGMNCALEDVQELDRCLEDSQTFEQAFRRFQSRRQDNARAISEMAMENYLEMRSSVTDPGYRLRRQLELALERRFPERFVPRYSLVMFHQMGYAQAQARGLINLEILTQLTRNAEHIDQIDWNAAKGLVDSKLTPMG